VSPLVAAIGILSVLALSALALGALALFQSRNLLRTWSRRGTPTPARTDSALDEMRASIEGLSRKMREIEALPGDPTVKSGLNLSKRSQVLRMHRSGDAPAQIASALGVPHQEVELLLKVQSIMLNKLSQVTQFDRASSPFQQAAAAEAQCRPAKGSAPF
jgi:hypothetical protein